MNRRSFLGTSLAAAACSVRGASPTLTEPIRPPDDRRTSFAPRSDVTSHLADFITSAKYSDLPEEVIALGKKSILDACGLALVGAHSKGSQILRAYFDSLRCADAGARVLGTAGRLPLRFAVFANGVSIHMEDFDDTQLAEEPDRVYGLLTHPTAPVLPVVIGTADTMPVSGRDFLVAYHVGTEVACKIAEACAPRAYEDGFHSTGVFGVFGSTGACAKLRGFTAEMTSRAIAIAASQASGLIENFGTLMKPFHAGHAAEAGVVATDLAMLGWSAAKSILEAQNGFFHAYGGTYDSNLLLNKLGRPWTFASPGVSIKPYPSGSLTHPAMTELARLIRAEGIKAGDVIQVEVGTNSQMPKALHNHRPQTGLEAKFSMEYCAAVLLVAGQAGLGEFTDAVVRQPAMQEMMGRVRFYVDPEAESAGYAKMTTLLKVHLNDGRVVMGRADFAKGSPANPMSFDEVAEKFHACASYVGWPDEKADRVVDEVRHLEQLPDVAPLVGNCSR